VIPAFIEGIIICIKNICPGGNFNLLFQCFISKRIPIDPFLQEIIAQRVNVDPLLQEIIAQRINIDPFLQEIIEKKVKVDLLL